LSLLTSFALAPVSLVPAALLAVMVGALSSTTVEVVRGTTPADWRLLLLSAATLGSVPVATLLARLGVHIHKRRAGALFGIVETTVPAGDGTLRLLRGIGFVVGRDAWAAVGHTTVIGLAGLLFGGLAVLLIAYGAGGVIGGIGALAATLLTSGSVQVTGMAGGGGARGGASPGGGRTVGCALAGAARPRRDATDPVRLSPGACPPSVVGAERHPFPH